MSQLVRCRPERFGQTAGERPVGVVTPPHDRLFINQVLNDVTTDFLIEGTQAGVEKDTAESADVLASTIVMLDCPFFQGFAIHRARHHPIKKAFTIEWRFFLFAYVGAQLLYKFVRSCGHKTPPFLSSTALEPCTALVVNTAFNETLATLLRRSPVAPPNRMAHARR